MRAVADGNQRRRRRPDRARMKRAHVVDRHRRQRRLAPDRRVAVRMVAVQQLQKGPVRDGPRHVAKLGEAMEPQLAHAIEIRFAQRRPDDDVRQQRERAIGEPAQHGRADDDRVRSDIGVELRADSRERLVDFDCRAVAAPFVEHVGRRRGETVPARRIGGRAAAHEQHQRNDRHLRMSDGPQAEAIRQRRLLDGGEWKGARRPQLRELCPVDLHSPDCAHETTARSESGAASAVRSCGTTLNVTRRAGSR